MFDIIGVLMLLGAFFAVFVCGDLVTLSVYKSLIFCAKTIVPSLFIYMILSEAFIEAHFFEKMSKVINKFFRLSSKNSLKLSVLLISILCGAPIGAKLSYSTYKKGLLSKKEAIILNAATNNVSLSFVFGICSTRLSLYKEAFVIMMLSSFLSTFILSKLIDLNEECQLHIPIQNELKMSKIIKNSTYSMINVCASIITFTFLGDMLGKYFFVSSQLVKGIFEFSSGICALNNESFVLMTFFLSFGGFSLHSQIISVWENELKYKYILFPKLLQAVISIFFCEIFILFVDKMRVLL